MSDQERAGKLTAPSQREARTIQSLFCEEHQSIGEAAASGYLDDECPTCVALGMRKAAFEEVVRHCGESGYIHRAEIFTLKNRLVQSGGQREALPAAEYEQGFDDWWKATEIIGNGPLKPVALAAWRAALTRAQGVRE